MKLYLFLEYIHQLTRIPICVYSGHGNLIKKYGVEEEISVVFWKEEGRKVFEVSSQEELRFYQHPYFPIAWFVCKTKEEMIFVGPTAIGKIESGKLSASEKKQIQMLPKVQFRDLLLAAVLILNECSEKEYTVEMIWEHIRGGDFQPPSHVLGAELRQYDSFQKNHTYAEEQAFFEHIRNGDEAYIRNKYEVMTPPHPVVVQNLQKNEEYMAVIEISMAARSAIEGGLTSREALLMNDVYLEKLAECQTLHQIFTLKKEACLAFARTVKQQKESEVGNPYVEDCKRDIYSRMREKIDLQKIADDIGISKEYMLKLFKKYEGISITDYILDAKLDAACNMLKFSDRKIGEISDYLSFGSLNYFSRIFTKRIGMSPKEYRKTHHQPNF